MEREHHRIYRILDADCNRAVEGLRVLEEVARFIFDHRELTQAFKELRHDLARVAEGIPGGRAALVAARDAARDVGAGYSPQENRADLWDLVVANARRVQEALRALEEFVKLVEPQAASGFKEMRFRSYTLEQQFLAVLMKGDGDFD